MYVFDYKVILHKYTKDNYFLKETNNIEWYKHDFAGTLT